MAGKSGNAKKATKDDNWTIHGTISSGAAQYVKETISSGGNRKSIPIRNAFVRSENPQVVPPLQKLISARAGMAVRLYVALIWRSSSAPYTTDFRAYHWAVLLDLDEPETNGARRVKVALNTLARHQLIKLTNRPGKPPVVTLLKEDGSGAEYVVPWEGYRDASGGEKDEERYFQLPLELWESGHLQQMSAAALAMLLVISEESRGKATPQWWSVEKFHNQFRLGKDVRAEGSAELERRRLVQVRRKHLPPSPGPIRFSRSEKTRKTYLLVNEATPPKEPKTEPTRSKGSKRRYRNV